VSMERKTRGPELSPGESDIVGQNLDVTYGLMGWRIQRRKRVIKGFMKGQYVHVIKNRGC